MKAAQPVPSATKLRLGVVGRFEGARGLGSVTEMVLPMGTAGSGEPGADRAPSYPFHSTAIAGGGRQIAAGAVVAFVVVASHKGTLEARELRPITGYLAPRR